MKTKKIILGILFATAMVFSNLSLANIGNGDDEITVKQYTWAELKQIYGEKIILAEGVVMDDQTIIFVANSPTPCEDPTLDNCGLAAAKAGIEARKAANECCCPLRYGWVCCDNGATLVVDALMEPNNGCK